MSFFIKIQGIQFFKGVKMTINTIKILLSFCLILSISIQSKSLDQEPVLSIPFKFEFTPVNRDDHLVQFTATDLRGVQLDQTIDGAKPKVPFSFYKIAIPYGYEVNNIVLTSQPTSESFEGNFLHSAPMKPLSLAQFPFPEVESRNTLTQQKLQFPESPIRWTLQKWHNVTIALIWVYPVQVNKFNQTLSFLNQGNISIELFQSLTQRVKLTNAQKNKIKSFVDNPDVIHSYKTKLNRSAQDYEHLIITTKLFANHTGEYNLSFYNEYLSKQGFKTKILTLESIVSEYDGTDDAQKIRKAIRNEYNKHNIQYVLLIGDADRGRPIIPVRNLRAKILGYNGSSTKMYTEDIPADFYYSCLDGEFDSNKNGIWGELDDGIDGQDVDLLPEVIVGRFSVDQIQAFENQIKKTIQMTQIEYEKKTLLLGETLFSELNLYGKDYLMQLIGQSTDHNYTTNGFTDKWTVDQLFDKDGYWSGKGAIRKIQEQNYPMVFHLGHSSTSMNMKLSSWWGFPSFYNEKPFFYYTQGCFAGDFTHNETWIEKLMNLSQGSFATISNSSYGLGPEDPDPISTITPGASHMLARKFVDALFSDHIYVIAESHQNSKISHIKYSQTQEMRWVYWTANYLGEPSLKLPESIRPSK